MNTTQTTITKFEDHEGYGLCTACGREGLRWIAVLSDGSAVGSECAKRKTGVPMPAPSKLAWLKGKRVVAEHATKWETTVLYRSESGRYALAINGVCQQFGGEEVAARYADMTA